MSRANGQRTNDCLIFTYHALDTLRSPTSLDPRRFREQMRILADSGAAVVPLGEVLTRPGSIALSFDDGYESFYEVALPELLRHRFPAIVFVVSNACGQRANWQSAPPSRIMSWAQLREVQRAGIEIGCHTATHRPLTGIAESDIVQEIDEGCREIAANLGVEAQSFAYPYGHSNDGIRRIIARRFRTACGVRLDAATADSDRTNLPRIDIHYFREAQQYRDLLNGARGYLRTRRLLRAVRSEIFRAKDWLGR